MINKLLNDLCCLSERISYVHNYDGFENGEKDLREERDKVLLKLKQLYEEKLSGCNNSKV